MHTPIEILIIAGPSCCGKTVLMNSLLAQRGNTGRPITSTTRTPRPGEIDGVDYHFLTRADFEEGLRRGDFVEHNEYGASAGRLGDYYGLSKAALKTVQDQGKLPVVILDALVGVPKVKAILPAGTIFINAPLHVLADRIRAQRPEAEIPGRLATAQLEIAVRDTFDVVLENDRPLDVVSDEMIAAFDTKFSARFQIGRDQPTACAATSRAIRGI